MHSVKLQYTGHIAGTVTISQCCHSSVVMFTTGPFQVEVVVQSSKRDVHLGELWVDSEGLLRKSLGMLQAGGMIGIYVAAAVQSPPLTAG
jgi:hypothetical protein